MRAVKKIETMLDPFFRIYDYLVENSNPPIRRKLMDEIDWSDRLIAIKGFACSILNE